MFTSPKIFSGFILIGFFCLCFCEAQLPRVNLLNLPIGSDCVQPYGVKGICTSFLDCTSLHNEIRARRVKMSDLYYYRCSFVGFEEITCCAIENLDRSNNIDDQPQSP